MALSEFLGTPKLFCKTIQSWLRVGRDCKFIIKGMASFSIWRSLCTKRSYSTKNLSLGKGMLVGENWSTHSLFLSRNIYLKHNQGCPESENIPRYCWPSNSTRPRTGGISEVPSTYTKQCLERCRRSQTKQISKNKILSESQFGFRTNHSTIPCMFVMICTLIWIVTDVAFLGLKKALNTVNHKILLKKTWECKWSWTVLSAISVIGSNTRID